MNILLHICCGVCAGAVAEKLMIEGHTVTGYFYNPNIHPQDEYKKRLDAAMKMGKALGFEVVEGPYDRENFFLAVKGHEYSGEGGRRCSICFEMRLKKTYEYMKKHGIDTFTTTLSVSPHKDAMVINSIGIGIDELRFIPANFKKKGGFQRSIALAAEMGIYRQNYCGCVYSLEEKVKNEKK